MATTSIPQTKDATASREQAYAARRVRARLADRIATGTLWAVAGFIGMVFLYICLYTIIKGLPSIKGLDFFTSGNSEVGIGPQIFNTFYLMILSLLFMLPIGGGAAIFLREYARQNGFVTALRFATETLTSTPTIIVGLLGYVFITSKVHFSLLGLQLHGLGLGFSRISGALTLAIINLPWMVRVMEDAFNAVPRDQREASLALGATRFQTITRAVIPAAIPGIVTGILVVSGRVIGESAALLYTVGQTVPAHGWFTLDPTVGGETLALHAYTLFSSGFSHADQVIRLGTALTLIVLVLTFNISARLLGSYINTRVSGKRS